MMVSGDLFYKIFYFCLFFYAISSCIRNCLNEEEQPPPEDQAVENERGTNRDLEINGTTSEVNADTAERRRELVLGRLEYRKILPPSSRSTTEQKSNDNKNKKNEDTAEIDLEKGEGRTASSNKGKGKDKKKNDDKDIEAETKKTIKNDDDDVPTSSTDTWLDSSVRSFIGLGLSSINIFNIVGTSSRNEEDNCCSICLEPYAVGDTVARLKKEQTDSNNDKDTCHHWFHEDCILQWLQHHDECPLCRKNMITTDVAC
mmetsp:Transcript_35910/g.38892  ORF Transcript_35910/g.38892 Transcript_35910/m.38892 type:complete len:258 (-) Transcript_35910:174-947(-)